MESISVKICYGFLLLLIFLVPVQLGLSIENNDEMCGNIDINECFSDTQTFLKLTALPFVTEEEELDKLCKQTIHGYNCSQMLYKNTDCLSPKNKELLPIFLSMAEYTHFMLCGDSRDNKGYLRDAYLGYSDCILANKRKMECCAQQTGISDLPILRIIEKSSKSLATREIQTCCPMSRYMKCVSAVATDSCGDAAANFTTEYVLRAAGEQVHEVCQKVPRYPDPDPHMCPDPVPLCSGCPNIELQNTFITITIGLLILSFLSYFNHK